MNIKYISGILAVVMSAALIGMATMVMGATSTNVEQSVLIENNSKHLQSNTSVASDFRARIVDIEKGSMTTLAILESLTMAVRDLNDTTKELTRLVSQIKILEEKIKHLEEDQ